MHGRLLSDDRSDLRPCLGGKHRSSRCAGASPSKRKPETERESESGNKAGKENPDGHAGTL